MDLFRNKDTAWQFNTVDSCFLDGKQAIIAILSDNTLTLEILVLVIGTLVNEILVQV